jgi:ABC-type multidrug transport system ATPase subunit
MQFWDQPTRGLDSKTALGFADTLRAEADQNGRTIVATMYQAGNSIYNQFDKVLVLADGCIIYYGPANTAQRYFESLGFVCPRGANIADFLTSVTVTTERVVAPGAEGKVPNTPQEFERAYQRSSVC